MVLLQAERDQALIEKEEAKSELKSLSADAARRYWGKEHDRFHANAIRGRCRSTKQKT
jgi:hypothetical protein